MIQAPVSGRGRHALLHSADAASVINAGRADAAHPSASFVSLPLPISDAASGKYCRSDSVTFSPTAHL